MQADLPLFPARAREKCLGWSEWAQPVHSTASLNLTPTYRSWTLRHRNSQAPSRAAQRNNNPADEWLCTYFAGRTCVVKEGPTKLAVKMARLSASVGLVTGFSRAAQSSGNEERAARFPAAVLDFHSITQQHRGGDFIAQSLGAAGRCPIEYRSSKKIVRR